MVAIHSTPSTERKKFLRSSDFHFGKNRRRSDGTFPPIASQLYYDFDDFFIITFTKHTLLFRKMFIFTSTQFRNLYLELCFQQEKQLTAQEFMSAAASHGCYISPMTASLIADDYDVLTEVRTEEKELVAV